MFIDWINSSDSLFTSVQEVERLKNTEKYYMKLYKCIIVSRTSGFNYLNQITCNRLNYLFKCNHDVCLLICLFCEYEKLGTDVS